MPENTFDEKSTMVQWQAWCRHAANHTEGNVKLYLCRYMTSLGHNEGMKNIDGLKIGYLQYRID